MDFTHGIQHWYEQHKRDLPWRHTSDPFHIWLSEVILQQTRVVQGKSYYQAFTERFQNVHELAAAREEEILRLWQGLGYYSRARNLHAAAKQVVQEFNGVFPTSYRELLQLQGVGPYTAAAVASIAFGEAQAVVDGNVYRVLSRWFDLDTPIDSTTGQKEFRELAQSLIDPENPGTFNQALMEFGATHCVPQKPDCMFCPFQEKCLAFQRGTVSQRPVKKGKTKQRDRYFHYFLVHSEGRIALQQRGTNDIWKRLFEFPLIETEAPQEWDELQKAALWKDIPAQLIRESKVSKHILSHQRIHAHFVELALEDRTESPEDWQWITPETLDDFALPRLITRYLEQHPAALEAR